MHDKSGFKVASGRILAAALLTAAALSLGGCGGKPQHEVWIIGLDGGDWDMAEPIIAAGYMPNLTAVPTLAGNIHATY